MGIFREVLFAKKEGTERDKLITTLFDAYFDRLVYFSFQMIGDAESARDIVQDAFAGYWQQKEKVEDHPSVVRRFLYTSVKNASLNYIRHQKIVQLHEAGAVAERAEEVSAMEGIIAAEVVGHIHQSLKALHEPYQTIGIKCFVEGLKNQEVADELGISVNTVKKQKQKAVELLRLRLTPEFFAGFVVWMLR